MFLRIFRGASSLLWCFVTYFIITNSELLCYLLIRKKLLSLYIWTLRAWPGQYILLEVMKKSSIDFRQVLKKVSFSFSRTFLKSEFLIKENGLSCSYVEERTYIESTFLISFEWISIRITFLVQIILYWFIFYRCVICR